MNENIKRVLEVAIQEASKKATDKEISDFATLIRNYEKKFEKFEKSQFVDNTFLDKIYN